jgi:hypothetical protein
MVSTRLLGAVAVLLAALFAAGAPFRTTAAQAADDKESAVSAQFWDCIRNKTGKNLLITLASGHAGGAYYVPKDGKLEFPVRKSTTNMVFVAYEYGTDNLVRMAKFTVLHQPYPPTNCLVITATQEAKRHKEEAGDKTAPAAAPAY